MYLEFQFSNAFSQGEDGPPCRNNSRVFLAADGVCGSLHIIDNCDSSTSLGPAVVLIILRGYVRTCIFKENTSLATSPLCSIFRKKILDSTDVRSWNGEEVLDFTFTLPSSMSQGLRTDGPARTILASSQHSVLPSSLMGASSMIVDFRSSVSRAYASVWYEMQARMVRGTSKVASTFQDIIIHDSLPKTPPICVGDFFPEYVCQQVAALKKNLFTRVGTVSVSTDQPAPFEFQHGRESAQTRLPISVVMEMPNDFRVVTPHFELVSDITWRLKASTFVMMNGCAALPTLLQASSSPNVANFSLNVMSRRLKARWSKWQSTPAQNISKTTQAFKAKQDLILSIPTSSLPPPTFCTSYLVRRYSISLHIHFEAAGYAKASLNVPVEVVYRSTSAQRPSPQFSNTLTCGKEQSTEFDDHELPYYVA